MAYCAHELKNKENTVAGKLVAVSIFYQQYKGVKLPLGDPISKGVTAKNQAETSGVGGRTENEEADNMGNDNGDEGIGEKVRGVLWIGIALSYLLMLRAEELFGTGKGEVHEVRCLQRRDVAFFKGDKQILGGNIGEADKVEVRLRGSEGDQDKKGLSLIHISEPTRPY